MIDAKILSMSGTPFIFLEESPEEGHFIHLGAVSSWRELLGYSDPVDALKAIYKVRTENTQETLEDGSTVWEEPMALLSQREQAREQAADAARERGEPLSAVVFAANTAAHNEVHLQQGKRDCPLNEARNKTRRALGLPDPEVKCSEETRTEAATLSPSPMVAFGPMTQQDTDDTLLSNILQGQEENLLALTQEFLHSLTGEITDPLKPGLED